MNYMPRTTDCGALCSSHEGEQVCLNGWVHRHRDHGGIYFIDLRDRYGKTQIVINDSSPAETQQLASTLRLEFCISVSGKVALRPSETINPNMSTGEIEVHVEKIEVLSECEVLPFMIEDEKSNANEDLRLRYRYLDLRSGMMQYHMQLRHKVMQSTREYLNAQDFLEIETPTLIRSTPEGARDFIVPSRFKAGTFYALPQSPQLYKQILMMSGMDKYYQLARCYRDEDARGDRQPEHTQIDIELSFVQPEQIYTLIEGLMKKIFSDALSIDITTPFLRFSYEDAMNKYGSDKPDLRYELEIQDLNLLGDALIKEMDFKVFNDALALTSSTSPYLNGAVKLLKVPNADKLSRKHIEQLEQTAKKYGAKGLAWAKYTMNAESKALGFSGSSSKFLAKIQTQLVDILNLQENDLLLFIADTWQTTCTALGAVRTEVAKLMTLVAANDLPQKFIFAWVTDFPLFDWLEETQSWTPAHHMFTMPQSHYLDSLETQTGEVKGELYDLVCNGLELASGSIRIHNMNLQQRIFDIINMPKEEAQSRFGFLLEALKYGAPPHGGIAPGLDRLLMIMTGSSSIREVMSFPKNTLAASPMDGSPNTISKEQLDDLHLEVKYPPASN